MQVATKLKKVIKKSKEKQGKPYGEMDRMCNETFINQFLDS